MPNRVFAMSVGGQSSLQVIDGKLEDPGVRDVVVEVKACGLNMFDLYIRQGLSPDTFPPCVLGLECAGIIEKIGEEITDFKVGDHVLVHCPQGGAFAENIIVNESKLLKFPDEIDFHAAAALTITYLTAYFCLCEIGGVKEGSTVFIQGAAGGVGWAATQLAKLHPGVKVFGTAAIEKHDAIKENGVDFPLAYGQDIKAEILKHSPEGVNIIIENMAGKDFQKCLELLSPLGTIILIGAKNMLGKEKRSMVNVLSTWWQTKNISPHTLIMKNRCVAGFHLNELQKLSPETFMKGWKYILDLLIQQKISPRIDSVFKFSEVTDACYRMSQRKNVGKIIITPI